MPTNRGVIALPYIQWNTVCLMCRVSTPLLQSSESISEDMEVKGESLIVGWHSVTYWFRLQSIIAMSSSIQMVLADKQPVLPPLCEPSPPHKVGGFLHLCTLSSLAVHANALQENRKKAKIHTNCICSCASHLPSVEHVVILCSALMKCRAGTTTGACAGDSLQCLLG